MLEMAAAAGTTDIVATPHADLTYKFQPELIRERVVTLAKATNGKPRIFEGCDFHLTFDNIQDAIANPSKYTINHKNYLLVEFSDLLIFNETSEIFRRMREEAGIHPVITHPERNQLLQMRLPQLEQWVAEGCYLQVTAQSLNGRFGNTARQFSLELLKRNLVHFIASDGHDTEHRPPVMDVAFEWLSRKYSPNYAGLLCVENPLATLTGDPLPPMPHPEASRKWFQFWK